jgi:single-strand DNA-binding protein
VVNKHIIVGRLGADPESRTAKSGAVVVTMSVATDHSVKRGDAWEKATEWHKVVVFGPQAGPCAQYLRKGSSAYIEGRVTTRKWQDKDGNDRYSTETVAERVQFLGGAPDGGRAKGSSTPAIDPRANYATEVPDDDIPF